MVCRRLILAALGVCLVGSVLLAKPGIIKTREGQVYDGDVEDVAGNDYVTVTVHGIPTQIDRADIESMAEGQGIDTEYQQRLAKLGPKDVKGRMELAQWAFTQKRYDLARDAADRALVVDPNSAEATQFLTLVQSQQRMERAKARAAATQSTEADESGPAVSQLANQPAWQLLTAGDMNRIRQEELRKTDTRARFRFMNDVERRFLASNRSYTLTDWRGMLPVQRAIKILDEGAPQLRDDVVVETDPAAIQEYRRLVQPLVLANCATIGCHGGMSAGSLVLNKTAETNELASYTNFYILEQYAQKIKSAGDQQSVFGSGPVERQMIDRTHSEDSLLLQYGLPQNLAKFPHPEVRSFRPAFLRGREDTKYRAIANWIGTVLAPVQPKYGIDYQPPKGKKPATAAQAETPAPATQAVRPR